MAASSITPVTVLTDFLGSGKTTLLNRIVHDPRIVSFAWADEEPRAWEDVETSLETLLQLHGERILRLKGLRERGG